MDNETYESALQAIYEFAVQWVCDEETAQALIVEAKNYYSDYWLMSSEDWYSIENPEAEFLECVIGEDVALDYFLVRRY